MVLSNEVATFGIHKSFSPNGLKFCFPHISYRKHFPPTLLGDFNVWLHLTVHFHSFFLFIHWSFLGHWVSSIFEPSPIAYSSYCSVSFRSNFILRNSSLFSPYSKVSMVIMHFSMFPSDPIDFCRLAEVYFGFIPTHSDNCLFLALLTCNCLHKASLCYLLFIFCLEFHKNLANYCLYTFTFMLELLHRCQVWLRKASFLLWLIDSSWPFLSIKVR